MKKIIEVKRVRVRVRNSYPVAGNITGI